MFKNKNGSKNNLCGNNVRSLRLAYAKKLWDEGASVTDACMGAGFADCSHFIAVFKRRFGDTPFRYKSKDV